MRRPLRIAYVLKRYPRLSETFVLHEMLELRRRGAVVVIVARKDAGEGVVHEATGTLDAPVHYLPSPSALGLDAWAIRSLDRFPGEARRLGVEALRGALSRDDYATVIQAAMIAPFLKQLEIDHVHAHFATWAATAASYISDVSGIPFSFTAHAKDIYHQRVDRKALASKIEKARFVVTVSDFNRRYLDDLLRSEGRSGRVCRIYNGVDLRRITPRERAGEAGLIVGVGRLVRKKGFDYLIEACRLLRDGGRRFRCIIVGEGEERAALERRVAGYSLAPVVSLPGARTHAEVLETVGRASVFVLPCVVGEDGDRDGLPTVLLESMALGVPVISTRVSGVPEIVADGRTGLLVAERDPAGLARAIERLLDSPALQRRLSTAALEKVRRDFSLADTVKTLMGAFLAGEAPAQGEEAGAGAMAASRVR